MKSLVTDATHWQGGDLRGLAGMHRVLDLGTCANRYGPPPIVQQVLRDLDIRQLRAHPYDAEQTFLNAYAAFLGADPQELIGGRGITEFIRLLGAALPTGRVAVVTPDYTDSIRSIPVHLPPPGNAVDTAETRLARIDEAMSRYQYVWVSNPNNPLGIHIDPARLAAVCRAHPRSVLIVDEAYIDFTAGGVEWSMMRAGVPNIVVVMSPNKLFGIAGTRTGMLWTPLEHIRQLVMRRKLNWSISYLDALVASTALSATQWAKRTRDDLLATSVRMETLLAKRYGGVVTGVPVHYRFVATEDAEPIHADLVRSGVVVRVFSGSQPGRISGLRITAPTEAEFPQLEKALTG